jgi:hypothetical protein
VSVGSSSRLELFQVPGDFPEQQPTVTLVRSFAKTEIFFVFVFTIIACSYLYEFLELLVTFWELSFFSPI